MKWRKICHLFDPTRFSELGQFIGFAQSPQALVLPDRIRVYFSIRRTDSVGKFLSEVCFADWSHDFDTMLQICSRQVLPLGVLGAFDEHGIFPFSPTWHGDKIVAYTCGWSRRLSVPVETATGFVVSEDQGLTFSRAGDGPIFGPSLHEPFLVGDSFVRKIGDSYYMWYIFGTSWRVFELGGQVERVYKIGQAISLDGIHFSRNGVPIIANILGNDECQALPTVVKIADRYHMMFCYRHAVGFRTNPRQAYRLGYAFSDDLQTWVRADERLSYEGKQGEWDSEMMCYPNLFECGGRIFLLYNGNQFGRFGFGLAELVGI